MPPTSAKNLSRTSEAILSTLSFFHIYNLPLTAERIWQLLYRQQATLAEVKHDLADLVQKKVIAQSGDLYGIESVSTDRYQTGQEQIARRLDKIKKYYWLLSALPYVEHVSIINSVAMGNADEESDIDFFVIAKPNRLYFVRSVIIILFKLLGVYKTRGKINEQFCFGFYITSDSLSIRHLLLPGSDPYMAFWLATIFPIIGEGEYQKFIKDNRWIYADVPNFRPGQRLGIIHGLKPWRGLKRLLSIASAPFAWALEPILRRIHVQHTFRLPENHWATSSTIANKQMLKLHALDPRKDLRAKFEGILSGRRQ